MTKISITDPPKWLERALPIISFSHLLKNPDYCHLYSKADVALPSQVLKASKDIYSTISQDGLYQCCTTLPGYFFPYVQAKSPKPQLPATTIWTQRSHLRVQLKWTNLTLQSPFQFLHDCFELESPNLDMAFPA